MDNSLTSDSRKSEQLAHSLPQTKTHRANNNDVHNSTKKTRRLITDGGTGVGIALAYGAAAMNINSGLSNTFMKNHAGNDQRNMGHSHVLAVLLTRQTWYWQAANNNRVRPPTSDEVHGLPTLRLDYGLSVVVLSCTKLC